VAAVEIGIGGDEFGQAPDRDIEAVLEMSFSGFSPRALRPPRENRADRKPILGIVESAQTFADTR
jgi:hypothetical protein